MASDQKDRLEEARQAINRVFRDDSAEPDEIAESLEILAEDIEMYAGRVESRLAKQEEEDDGEGDEGG